jgi:tripeptide aminopeptidase
MSLTGTVEHAEMDYIVRDHDRAHFEMRKQQMEQAATDLNALYGEGTVEVTLRDQYYNMKDRVLPQCARQIALVSEAMRQAGVQPDVRPIRGGTDGAMLSFKGLPCPNLFTGGHNFHGRYEYIPYGAMEKACEVLRRTVQLWAGDTWER